MAMQFGSTYKLLVGAVPVKWMQQVTNQNNVQTNSYPVFIDPPVSWNGPDQRSINVQGAYDPDDAGQEALRAAARAKTPVTISSLYDGTNGFSVSVLVSSGEHGANADGSPQTQTFTLAPQGDYAEVGTGPLP